MEIKRFDDHDKTQTKICMLNSKLLGSNNIIEGKEYYIKLGNIDEVAIISSNNNDINTIYLSERLFNRFKVVKDMELNPLVGEKNICLAPVVGILLRDRQLHTIRRGVFDRNISEYVKANRETNCLLFFFSPKTVDVKNDLIKGYFFNHKRNRWIYSLLPLPDVVYDIATRLDNDELYSAEYIRNTLKYKSPIKFINNCFQVDKWNTYNKIFSMEDVKEHIPETRIYKSFEDVKYMLDRFNFIFLKSIDGCSGKEVLSVDNSNGKYELHYYDKKLRIKTITDLRTLSGFIINFFKNKVFIIQQGIRLVKYNGCKMDLRLLIQKDIEGQWCIRYYGVRTAKSESNITNFSTGGGWTFLDKIYDNLSKEMKHIKLPKAEEIGYITLKIANCIEKEFGSFGELGMDMGIDEKGKIWFIEANSTPDKTPLAKYDINNILPQYSSILDYSLYLVKRDLKIIN